MLRLMTMVYVFEAPGKPDLRLILSDVFNIKLLQVIIIFSILKGYSKAKSM